MPDDPGTRLDEQRRVAASLVLEAVLPALLHDLAGRLNALSMNVLLLADLEAAGTAGDESKERAARVRELMERFSAAFRDFALAIQPEGDEPPAALAPLLRRALTLVTPFARKRGVDIARAEGDDLDCAVAAPAGLVREALIVALLQAARTAKEGGALRVEATRSGGDARILITGARASPAPAGGATESGLEDFLRAALDHFGGQLVDEPAGLGASWSSRTLVFPCAADRPAAPRS